MLKGQTRSVQTGYRTHNPIGKSSNLYITLQGGTFQGDPGAPFFFNVCQNLVLELVEKHGGSGYPLPSPSHSPGLEAPPPPIPINVFGFADDTNPALRETSGRLHPSGRVFSLSMTTLGQGAQRIINNGSNAGIMLSPGTRPPVPPPSILAIDADGIFGPCCPKLLPTTEAIRFLGARFQHSPAPDPENPNLQLEGSTNSTTLSI